jgi:L-ascorbate metabolism protein UlaG (beta-lactamase superfamily)
MVGMTFPRSDHFNGKTFFNRNHENRTFLDVWRWRRTRQLTAWPKTVPLAPQSPAPASRDGQLVITWIGHATFLVQTTQGNVLTDPHFSNRCGPFGWLGPRRVQPPAVPLDALPPIDYVLLSHDHYDHCDLVSLRALAKRSDPLVITPLGNAGLVRRAGLRRVVELDWWQAHAPQLGMEVTLTPARHWSNRLSGRRNGRLWGGFHVRQAGRTWWFAGDTGYDPDLFGSIRERLGAPEVAMVPIGAYEPRWFMQPMHCNPAEAVQIHRDVAASTSLAMHWGAWQLTDEGREEPVRALGAALRTANVGPSEFRALMPGETVVL